MTFEKILSGVSTFNRLYLDNYRTALERLGPNPPAPLAAMLTCMDSRILPHVITRSAPGELFVLRNAGNLMPPCDAVRSIYSDEAEAAAVEYLVTEVKVPDIIVCGHSGCIALRVAMDEAWPADASNLRFWLRHANPALAQLRAGTAFEPDQSDLTRLSQINVMTQIDHLRSYPFVRDRVESGLLQLHGWFFDLARAEVQAWDEQQRRFVRIEQAVLEESDERDESGEEEEPTSLGTSTGKPSPFLHPRDQIVSAILKKRTFRK